MSLDPNFQLPKCLVPYEDYQPEALSFPTFCPLLYNLSITGKPQVLKDIRAAHRTDTAHHYTNFCRDFASDPPVFPSVVGLEVFGDTLGFLAVDGFGRTLGAPPCTGGRPLGTTGVAAGMARLDASYLDGWVVDVDPSFLCGAESDRVRLELGDGVRRLLDGGSRYDDSACPSCESASGSGNFSALLDFGKVADFFPRLKLANEDTSPGCSSRVEDDLTRIGTVIVAPVVDF